MSQKYHRDDVVKALVNYYETYGVMPTVEGLENAPREFFPSPSTVAYHLGSLTAGKRELIRRLRKKEQSPRQLPLPF
jgi:hypothetical protein